MRLPSGSPPFQRKFTPQSIHVGSLTAQALSADERLRFCVLGIDPASITWKRVTDTNDRYLREVQVGMSPSEKHSKTGEQLSRDTGFQITVASEIMAVLALATDLQDLRSRQALD